jgi:hypothetical protein
MGDCIALRMCHQRRGGRGVDDRVTVVAGHDPILVCRYLRVMTNPLRSAATINPDWKPESVSTAPF